MGIRRSVNSDVELLNIFGLFGFWRGFGNSALGLGNGVGELSDGILAAACGFCRTLIVRDWSINSVRQSSLRSNLLGISTSPFQLEAIVGAPL
jgi:hypothetical protein